MKRNLAAVAAVLAGYLCAGTAKAQQKDVERTRITTETMMTPSSTLTTQTVDIDYEIDKRRDQGWNSQWGLLFSLNNIFSFNGNNPIIAGFDGLGAAAFYTLSPDMMVRGGFTLSRTHNPSAVVKTTQTAGDVDSITYTQTVPGTTAAFRLDVHGDALWRLTRNKVAPYVGGGAVLGYSYNRQSVDDEATNPLAVTSYRGRNTDLSLGVRGIVGAEWRIHSNFAFFAEYNLGVNLLHYTITDQRTTFKDSKDNPTASTSFHTESNVAQWFNVSTVLAQGAQLGVMVFF